MLAESNSKVKEHLDIKYLIEGEEFVKTALSVLLSMRQRKIVKYLSMLNLDFSQGIEGQS